MNNKQIIIDAPQGKVIDLEHFSQTGNVKFIDEKPAKIEFPKKWELQVGDSFYININSEIQIYDVDEDECTDEECTVFLPTKTLAEQMLIFTQLITMRERYREIEKLNNPELGEIDWNNTNQTKYAVTLYENKLEKCYRYGTNATFSFKLDKTRDEFAKNFGGMILQCKNIIG